MRVADYIAQRIKKETDVVFGVTGGNIVNMVDAFYKAGLKVVPMHHEQAAAMAADGYAKVSGKLGVCFATSGPGGQNLLTGLGCAYYDSSPVLAIVGQVPTKQMKPPEAKYLRQLGFQESENWLTLGMAAKMSALVTEGDKVASVLDDLVGAAKKPRMGPAVLEIPDDVQRDRCDELVKNDNVDTTVEHTIIHGVLDDIRKSKRPVVIIGSGARGAHDFNKSINKLNVPALLTWGAIDMLPDDHPLNVRDFGVTSQRIGNYVLKHADFILAIGTRLDTHEVAMDEDIIRKCTVVDVDYSELDKAKYHNTIKCDAELFLNALSKLFSFADESWINVVQFLREKYTRLHDGPGDPYHAIEAISDAAPENAIIVSDAGQTVTWTFQAWKVKKGQRLFTAFNHSPMGYALPAAIGAHFAAPDRPVYCITGDGGMMMNIQELANVGGNQWPIRIYVLNNGGYGMIRQTQSDWPQSLAQGVACDKRTGLHFPDFPLLAAACDIGECEKGPFLRNLWIDGSAKIHPKLKAGDRLWNQSPHLSEGEEAEIDEILSR